MINFDVDRQINSMCVFFLFLSCSVFIFRYADLNTFSTSEKNHIIDETCDEVVTKPTIFMKLDAGINTFVSLFLTCY